EDWEQCKFEKLLDYDDGIRRGPFGSALKKEYFVQNSDYVVYEQNNAISNHFKTRYKITEEKFKELHKFELLPGDFIMSGAGTIGRVSLVPPNISRGVINQALIRIRLNETTDSGYFLEWIMSPKMQRKLTETNPGSAMVNLVPMRELKNWKVKIPTVKEQIKISRLLNTLQKTISLHKR
ncbi:restriction endonuclease subunit S, partial [Nosocomiicoccus ampullae]